MTSGRTLQWSRLRGRDFESIDRERTVVTVSISPLEVHGPHLPTMTDNLEAESIVDRAMDRFLVRHPDVLHLKLPPVFLGTDVLPRAGSIMARSSTVVRVVEDLGRSIARQGFRRIRISNFHAGPRHLVALEVGCDRVNRRFGAEMVSVFSLLVARLRAQGRSLEDLFAGVEGLRVEDLEGDAHAGVLETSLLLHLAGDCVDGGYRDLPRQIDAADPREARSMLHTLRALRRTGQYYQRNTYAGAPAKASAALGERMLSIIADFAADGLEDVWSGRMGPKDARSPLWKARGLFLSEPLGWLVERLLRYEPRVF